MKRFIIFSLILLIIFFGFGCRRAKKALFEQILKGKQEVAKVESVELAEAILWPKPYRLSLLRDPFRPLIGESSLLAQGDTEFLSRPDIMDIRVLGILKKMQGGSIALLEFSLGVALVREGDKVGKWTVKSIDSDKVFLESEGKSRILEIGGEE